ncbi:MAG: bifunctional (p)ppGpp synthetase/guanosine-3',5'-bis(diphosphate) 3'-pyrophosphohydrolase [Candidatus Doudnabacteria bacterium]|nr:bifunctional (p)ppGpp synthetase/guanosine-3',5'-bis(diphosphate) 3'-pyrophosphohydrolase [Candidatus Doudnabacteria bacterium]
MTLFFSKNLLSALKFASVAHADQKRKDEARSPYISHPAAVGYILQRAGFDEDVIIAGILHDVIEDTTYTYADIEKRFGKKVADLVQEVSEDVHAPYDQRKDGYIDKLKMDSPEGCAISGADLLANRIDMLLNLDAGDDLWARPPYSLDFDKKLARDLKRIEIIKSKVKLPFIDELESVTVEVHKRLTEKIKE